MGGGTHPRGQNKNLDKFVDIVMTDQASSHEEEEGNIHARATQVATPANARCAENSVAFANHTCSGQMHTIGAAV